MESILLQIKNRRLLKGYSQEYMGMKLEISQRAYGKIENGHTKLNFQTLKKIARILGVSYEVIFEEIRKKS
jgi:transcriptional regulator with XRE-family HTH domain